MSIILRLSVSLLLAFSPFTQAQIYQWVDESGRKHFSDRPPQNHAFEAKKQERKKQTRNIQNQPTAASTNQSRTPAINVTYRHPRSSESLGIRRLLEARKFDQLNDLLTNKQIAVQNDISEDIELQAAYKAFSLTESRWEDVFDEWVAQFPDSYTSYLARATYRIQRAWDARGGAYINKTPQDKIDRMKQWLAVGRSDIERALSLNNHSLWAYCLKINAAKATGQYPVALAALREATSQYPTNYIARQLYLETLDPKWGGSDLAMIGFAQRAQIHANTNPNIKRLVVFAAYETARMAYIDGQYEKALELLDVAVDQGGDARTFHLRAKTYRRLNDLERALKDVDRAIGLEKDNSRYFYTRARVYLALKRYGLSFKDTERAHVLDPSHKPTERLRQRLLSFAQHPDSNFMVPEKTADSKIDWQDPASLFNHAKRLVAKNQFAEAKDALDKAINLSPTTFEYYKAADYALFKMGKTRDILEYWARYLTYRPNDGRAYFERSGTYYHLQDYAQAKTDAKRAAELGIAGAAKLYKELQALSPD